MQRVPATGKTLKLIDVSHWQAPIDWNLVKAAGIAGVYMKATQGLNGVDPQFHLNWNNSLIAGLPRGAYHYFDPDADAQEQAYHFTQILGQLQPGDLPPVLDGEILGGGTLEDLAAAYQDFLNAVMHMTERVPMFYTNFKLLGQLNLPDSFTIFPLWIEDYDAAAPWVPAPYKTWALWQYSQNGRVAGVGKPGAVTCDLNLFNGPDLGPFIQASLTVPDDSAE